MSDDNTSILEFSSSIASAEAPPPLPVGEYTMTVTGCEHKVSSNTGNPMIVTTFRVAPEDYPADFDSESYPDGVSMTLYTMARDVANDRFRIRKLCEACGVAATRKLDLNGFMGMTARGNVQHEDYEGVANARIKNLVS